MDPKQEKRNKIIDAADRLFSKAGPMRTNLADIARQAEMSTANLYNFFPSKEAIIGAVGERYMRELQRNLLAEIALLDKRWDCISTLYLGAARDAREKLANEMDVFQLLALGKAQNWQFVDGFRSFLLKTTEALIRAGVASKEFGDVDAADAALGIFDCMSNAWNPAFIVDYDPATHDTHIKRQLDLLRRALG